MSTDASTEQLIIIGSGTAGYTAAIYAARAKDNPKISFAWNSAITRIHGEKEDSMDSVKNLPVAVIGAGPIGLATAAHLLERGLEPAIFEQGSTAGAAIEQWRHIRLFSPGVSTSTLPPSAC